MVNNTKNLIKEKLPKPVILKFITSLFIISIIFYPGHLFGTMSKVKSSIFYCHRYPVTAIALSPDGSLMATGDNGGKVIIWNKNRKPLLMFTAHNKPYFSTITGLAFTPDKKKIISSARDSLVRIWSINGTLIKTLRGHRDEISSLAMSSDGFLAASSSHDKTVRIWNLKTGRSKILHGHKSPVHCVLFTPDGRKVISSSGNREIKNQQKRDNSIRLWNTNGRQLKAYTGLEYPVGEMALSPDGKTLAVTYHDEMVRKNKNQFQSTTAKVYTGIWNLKTGRHKDFKYSRYKHTSAAFSPDGNTIAFGTQGGESILLDSKGSLILSFKEKEVRGLYPKSKITGILFSNSGKNIITVSENRTIRFWDLKGRNTDTLVTPLAIGGISALSRDWKKFLIIPENPYYSKPILSDLADWECKTLNLQYHGSPKAIVFNPGARYLALATSRAPLLIFKKNGSLKRSIKAGKRGKFSLAYCSDGSCIAAGSSAGTVFLLEPDGTIINTLKGHRTWILAVAVSRDGSYILSGDRRGTVILWKKDGTIIKKIRAHGREITSLSFSGDGKHFASASIDRTIKIWHINGNPAGTLKGHRGSVNSVFFSPQGLLVSGSSDETVKIWNRKGKCLHTFSGSKEEIMHVSVSENGKTAAAISLSHTVIFWNIETGQIRGKLVVTRNKEMIYVTPDGSYDLSDSSAMKYILLKKGDRYITNTKDYRKKGLLSDMLKLSFP